MKKGIALTKVVVAIFVIILAVVAIYFASNLPNVRVPLPGFGYTFRDAKICYSRETTQPIGDIGEGYLCANAPGKDGCYSDLEYVKNGTQGFMTGGCDKNYVISLGSALCPWSKPQDMSDYEVSAVSVNNHGYIFESVDSYWEAEWVTTPSPGGGSTTTCYWELKDGPDTVAECCGDDTCNSDNTDGIRQSTGIFTNRDFQIAWCGKEDIQCLLCGSDEIWHVCKGSYVPPGRGVGVESPGNTVDGFTCKDSGDWV
jgi:hypothetical protein